MNIYGSLAICFAPLVLALVLFRLFSVIRLPTGLAASLLGLLAVLPITAAQFLLPDGRSADGGMLGLFLRPLLFNGFQEEMIKLLVILLIPAKKLSLRQFFAAALLLGICLGCFESSVYFLHSLQEADARGARLIYQMIFLRIFSADLIHTFCAGLSGLFVWGLRHGRKNPAPVALAVLTHGLFNFFVRFGNGIRWFAAAAVLLAAVECRARYSRLAASDGEKTEPAGRP